MRNLTMKELGDYTLLARVTEDNKIYEYVVAWCYNYATDSWAQGHYFRDVADAMQYMVYKKADLISIRKKFVEDMHEYIRTKVDDETAYMKWICLVPDEPCEEDFTDIASDEDLWTDACELFGRLVKEYK